jgi:hypothetical protein
MQNCNTIYVNPITSQNINYPITLDNLKTFEMNNNELVFVYTISSENKSSLAKEGNHEICVKNKGNIINLLLIQNEKIALH